MKSVVRIPYQKSTIKNHRLKILNNQMSNKDSITSICVVGASGDLAKKKIFPALFSLYVEGLVR